MSIRDQGYHGYEGGRTSASGRWLVVLGQSLRLTARQPWVIVVLVLAIFPTLIAGAVMYFKTKFWAMLPPEQASLMPDPGLLVMSFLVSWYGTPVMAFLMAMLAGGGAVSDDIRMNAFQFYFARPLTRDQYVAGKLLSVYILVAIVTVGPAVILAMVRLAMMRSGVDHAWPLVLLLLRGTVLGLLEAAAIAVPAVALSSLSPRRGLVQGGFAALFLLPWIVGAIAGAIVRSPWPNLLSVPAQMEAIGARLFAVPLQEGQRLLLWWPSLAMVGAVIAGSVLLLRWRLSSVEVVAG